MNIYYICEYCEQVFSLVEVEGEEGEVHVQGICDECAMEMGLVSPNSLSQHFYS